jgi:hypothetical protein
MRRRAGYWSLALQGAIALSVIVGAVLLTGAVGVRQPSESRLGVAVDELRARAAECRIVANALARGAVGETYVRAQAQQLARLIGDTEEELVRFAARIATADAREAARRARGVRTLAADLERAAQTPSSISGFDAAMAEHERALDTLRQSLAASR